MTQTSIERHFPVNEISALVRVERNHDSRPPLYLHRVLSLMECLTPWLVVRRK